MNSDWPELEDAKRKKEEERERAWRELEGELFAEDMEKEIEKKFQSQAVMQIMGENTGKFISLVEDWDEKVYPLLFQIADAKWGEPRKRWPINNIVISTNEGKGLSLYWEANCSNFYYSGWYSIELYPDEDYEPFEFIIECKEKYFKLICEPTIEALKGILVEAFELGPIKDLDRRRKYGLPFEKLQKLADT